MFDNSDEFGVVFLAYWISYGDMIKNFLTVNGWDANHFLIGSMGQFIYILFAYLSGDKRGGFSANKVGKNLTALFLGGTISMLILPTLPFLGATMSLTGVGIGFAFQGVWKKYIAKYIDKLFHIEEDDKDDSQSFAPGGTPNGGGG